MKNKVPYNTINIEVSKNMFNDIYLPLLEDSSRFKVIYGGAGSGKSVYVVQELLLTALKEEGHKILVTRKVARTLRNSVFTEIVGMIKQWNLESLFTINKSDMRIECVNGSQFIFAGLDDVEKLKSISGITKIWMEEASETKQDDLQQLNLRLRGKTKWKKQIIVTFNPVSDQHWLKEYFFDNKLGNRTVNRGTIYGDNCSVTHSTYLDNKFIDDEYKEEIETLKDIDENYYKIYALGYWGSLGDMVYKNYVVETVEQNPDYYDFVFNGLDFGFNDPTALVRIGFKDQEIYIMQEFYERKLTNTEVINKIKKKYQIHNLQEWIVADSAEPDRIKEFRQSGFKIKGATKGKDSIRFGIDYIKRMKIHIDDSCVNFLKEIQMYQYRKDKDGNVLDEPVDAFNHLMDAMRYALYDYLIQQQKLPKRRTANRSQLKRKGW